MEFPMDDLNLKDLIAAFGTPVGLGGVAAYVVWRVAKWATPIIESLVEKHIEVVDTLTSSVGKLADGHNVTHSKLDAVHKDLISHRDTVNSKLDIALHRAANEKK